jgi:hypothetical protein
MLNMDLEFVLFAPRLAIKSTISRRETMEFGTKLYVVVEMER